MIEVMHKMSQSNVLEKVERGSYRFIVSTQKIIATIKNTNQSGAFVDIDEKNEVFIAKSIVTLL